MRILSDLAMVGSAQYGLSSPWDCSVYAVRVPQGLVLVDTGAGTGEDEIVANLAEDFPGVPVMGAILTHSHMDHAGGADGLRQRLGCEIAAPQVSREILELGDEKRSGLQQARERGGYPPTLCMKAYAVDKVFCADVEFQLGGQTWRPVHVRGHSHDSFCLTTRIAGKRACFSGDVVFYGGVLGVINSWDSGMQGYVEDLPRLGELGVDMLLPGHGMFTLKGGQRSIDAAIQALRSGFLPAQIGQGAAIFL